MNAPPWPMNPAVGEWFQNWVWNGSRWVCSRASGIRVLTQVFNASGPYQPSPGLVSLTVECVGGGGTGGDAGGDATAQAGGGGGGSGGYSRITLPAALVAGGVNVTIGAGGSIPASPPNIEDREAGGAPTSFGAFCVANGGQGGGGNASAGAFWGFPGAGAPPGTGDITLPGNPGDTGTTQSPGGSLNVIGGMGGAIWGGGGVPTLTGNPGVQAGMAGTGPGAGGSGAGVNTQAGEANGGPGANGICVVTEYCWADSASDGEDCFNPQTVNLNARLELERSGWGPPGPRPPGPPGWNPHGGDDYEG